MTVNFNFKVDSSWRSSLNTAFSFLRRTTLLTPGDFELTDFDPRMDFHGMTITNFLIRRCKYLKINKYFFYSIDIAMTLAAPFAAEVDVQLPLGLTVAGDSGFLQCNHLLTSQAGVNEAGHALGRGTTSLISLQRGASGNFGAGNARFIGNGFIEVN